MRLLDEDIMPISKNIEQIVIHENEQQEE